MLLIELNVASLFRKCISPVKYCLIPLVSASLPPNLGGGRQQLQQRAPAPPPPPDLVGLPSYDQVVPDGMRPVGVNWAGQGEEEEEEEVIDENERIALQEAEDERIAREMMQKEEDEVCVCVCAYEYGLSCLLALL